MASSLAFSLYSTSAPAGSKLEGNVVYTNGSGGNQTVTGLDISMQSTPGFQHVEVEPPGQNSGFAGAAGGGVVVPNGGTVIFPFSCITRGGTLVANLIGTEVLSATQAVTAK